MKSGARFSGFTLTFFVIAGLLCPLSFCQEKADTDEKQIADAIHLVHIKEHNDLPLRAARLPELDDDVIYLKTQRLPSNAVVPVPLISFYSVTLSTYGLKGNVVVSHTFVEDGNSKWLVAIDRENGEKFLLEGWTDALSEFNRLVKDINLRVSSSEGALDEFDSYLKMVRGQQFISGVVQDDLRLECAALNDFRRRFPSGKRREAFQAWWNNVSPDTKKSIVPPQAVAVSGGFEISFFVYDRGGLTKQRVTLSSDGTITEGKSKTIM